MSAELTYTQMRGQLLPDITLSETATPQIKPLSHYGMMRKAFLKEHRPIIYNRMLLKETLFPHLREVEEAANLRLEQTIKLLTVLNPDKEATDSIKAQADEIVRNELIYAD